MNEPYGRPAYPLSATNEAAQTRSSSPVRDRVSSLEQWLSDLHSVTSSLEERFDTILTPVPPTPAERTSAPTPQRVQSHLQGRLEILCDGFAALQQRLQMLGQRTEL